jgi:Ca2+-binding EF-hand superfamily protein
MTNPTEVSTPRHAASLRELKEDFVRADRDRDGRIGFDEFRNLLQGLEAGMSEEELRIGFREVDADRDGLIDLREFTDWWSAD